MEKIVLFLKEKKNILFFVGGVYFLFYLLFVFRSYPFSEFWLIFEIGIFLLFIYMIIGFMLYKKELKWKDKSIELKAENEKLKEEMLHKQKELEDYFLLWVHQVKIPITVANLLLEKEENQALQKEIDCIDNYTSMALNYIRISQKTVPLDISYFSLDESIQTVLKKYSRLFIYKHLSLFFKPTNARVLGDQHWFEILLEQFLSNAVKYTQKGSITITYRSEDNCLMIEDTGIGIHDEDLPLIFRKGYTGFNGRVNQKASGLGLFLAKEIANRLHIRIEVRSQIQKGTTFFLYLSKL